MSIPMWRLPAALVLFISLGCGDGTGPGEPGLQLVGLLIATDGTPGTLAATVGPDRFAFGSSSLAAAGTLALRSGETVDLTGRWDENECPPSSGCIPERWPILSLSGDGWTVTSSATAPATGTFSGPGRSGRFYYSGSSDASPVIPLCGTVAGTFVQPDTSGSFEGPWLMMLGRAAVRFVFAQGDTTSPPIVFEESVSERTIHAALDPVTITGTAAEDGRAASGSYVIRATGLSVDATWQATAAGCVAPVATVISDVPALLLHAFSRR